MIIKKYEAGNETDAMMMAKDELGKDAVIMNIKKIQPRGIMKLFKKPYVEVTAAADEVLPVSGGKNEKKAVGTMSTSTFEEKKNYINGNIPFLSAEVEKTLEEEKRARTSAIEEKLDSLQNMIEKQLENSTKEMKKEEKVVEPEKDSRTNQCIELVKKQLKANEVDEKYIQQILDEVKNNLTADAPVDNILTSIYQKIVLKLGQSELIEVGEGKPKFFFFTGPTGVGKTTSIAKIASDLKLNKKLNVALVTSDTYRIAAVEQLRTYASILNIPVNVVYSSDELRDIKEELNAFDAVLIDTAGRSHKNKGQHEDLVNLIDVIDEEERETYLVLSATTKYTDMVNIVNVYSDLEGYKLIFTKLDETSSCGSILNIRMMTQATLSYATWGQDVPHDIGRLDAQNIAKQLLGGSN